MPTLLEEEPITEMQAAESNQGRPCYLCGGRPAEITTFKCEDCGDIFWKGYLCARALASLARNPVLFINKHFPFVHEKCSRRLK